MYLYSYRPSGDVVPEGEDAKVVEKYKDHPVEHDRMRRWYSQRADVVVTAIDGGTGKTVWQSVWPMKQGNFQTHKCRRPDPTPAIGNGVLVVADYSWGLHAYDAKTGALQWSRGGGDTVAKNNASVGPVVVGDVAVFATRQGTVGLDLHTGQELWQAPAAASVRRLKLAGQDRVLAVGGTTSLVDPATGKTLGAIPELKCGSNAGLIVVDGRIFYQPEGQHGRQHIHVVDPGELTVLGKVWSPLHNDTTAYGQMALGNVVVDGRLIVRGMDGIYCYDLRVE